MIRLKRAYDEPSFDDGFRILIDRLWPRGISKSRLALDVWLKDVAPSSDLRTWFGHREDRFKAFEERYVAELERNPTMKELRELVQMHDCVTLVYGAKDPAINHAVVLAAFIEQSPSASGI